MGWKGTLRSVAAAHRRVERDARRRQRELETRRRNIEKLHEIEQAKFEVEVYENRIELLTSVHRDASDVWNWQMLQNSSPPVKPSSKSTNEETAKMQLDQFRPSIFDKMLGRIESKREKLRKAVEQAKLNDMMEYDTLLEKYQQEYEEWETIRSLANKILAGEIQGYIEAIEQTSPFTDIAELGSSVHFKIDDEKPSLVEATLHVNSEHVIPSETKTLLKSGKVSAKKMTDTKFYDLYQDYVCGCVFRVARELFALLPIDMVIVTAVGKILNSQTGHMEEKSILSVAMPRKTVEGLNFQSLDPSDALVNFVHRMKFKKTKGFEAVENLSPTDINTMQQ